MLQLFVRGNATTLFFEEKDTILIWIWINNRLKDDDNIFNLNEAWSANVEIESLFSEVNIFSTFISGGEDLVELSLEKVTPIVIDFNS